MMTDEAQAMDLAPPLTVNQVSVCASAPPRVPQSEMLFRHIWENSRDGMRLTDSAGCTILVNEAYCRLVGKSRADVVGQAFTDLYAEAERDHVIRAYAQRFADRTIKPRFESELTLWDGRRVWFDVTNSFLEFAGEGPLLLSIFRDTTAKKCAAEEKLNLERKLLDAQRLESLGILAGGIAHDFNNLLVAVLGNAGLALLDLPAGSPVRDAVTRIESAALRAAELTNQMLAYSGKGRFHSERVKLDRLVRDLKQQLRRTAGPYIRIQFELHNGLPDVEGDPTQLRQIVLNLFVNATEALNSSAGQVRVVTKAVTVGTAPSGHARHGNELGAGQYVVLEVSDTGCGMDQTTRTKVFDPFFTTKFAGRGLGLATVLGIVRSHGGTIEVESATSQGSTFRVFLPAASSTVKPAAAPRPATETEVVGGTMLVIDDEPSVRDVTARMLETFGFTVLTAANGRTGIDLFRRHERIDCVLLDLTMPELSGEEVFHALHEIRPEARVVLMSGYSEFDTTWRFAGKGLAGFLQKPFSPVDLRAKIAQALCTRVASQA